MRSVTVTFASILLCAAAMLVFVEAEERYEIVCERRAVTPEDSIRRMRMHQQMLFGKRHTFVKRGDSEDRERDSAQEDAIEKRHTFV